MPSKPLLIFDLDGTLVSTTPRMIDEFHRLVSQLANIELSPKDVREAERWNHYYQMPSTEYIQDLSQSNGHRNKEYWIRYATRHFEILHLSPELAAKIVEPLVDRLIEYNQTVKRQEKIMEDAEPTLKYLKTAGFRIALLTNRDNQFPPIMLDGLGQYFENIIKAGEVGLWKPDPRIFQLALERLKVNASNAYYIGDNYYSDILGAESAGIKPILVDRQGLFPEARCPVITCLHDLILVVENDLKLIDNSCRS